MTPCQLYIEKIPIIVSIYTGTLLHQELENVVYSAQIRSQLMDTVINVVPNSGIFRCSQFSAEYGRMFK